jgi:hypothetical protein
MTTRIGVTRDAWRAEHGESLVLEGTLAVWTDGHSIGTTLLGLAILVVGLLPLFGSFHVLALVGLVQWIGLLSIAGALVSGASAVAGPAPPAAR